MELCFGLLFLFLLLAFVALVGHGLWLLGAAIVGAASPGHAQGSERCVACGTRLPRGRMRCGVCRLDQQGRYARQLRDVESAERIVRQLVRDGRLEPESGAKFRSALAEFATVHAASELGAPWETIEDLLQVRGRFADWEPEEERGLLFFFDQLEPKDWGRLRSESLYRIGRFLQEMGLRWRALDVFESLASLHAVSSAKLSAATHGARLAAELGDRARCRSLLAQARRWATAAEDRERLAAIERSLQTQETIPLVETAEPADAIPADAIPAVQSVEPIPFADVVAAEPEPIDSAAAEESRRPAQAAARSAGRREASAVPAAPAPPRRSFGEMLAGFMEEKNILWGELLGGLLIVGCSIALVISHWQTLERIPFFPFLILTAITAAIFAAGQYTLSHWKLESTSRSLLLIATLLTPLDFLALAGLTKGEGGPIAWLIECASLAGFGWLTWQASRILTRPILEGGGGRSDLAAVGTSTAACALVLLTPRTLALTEPVVWLFVATSMVPGVLHCLCTFWIVRSLGRRSEVSSSQASALLLFMGQTTFAVAVGMAFLVYWSNDAVRTFSHLALPIAVLAFPMTLVGAMIRRRAEPGETAGTVRVLGTALGILGAALLALGLGLSWPRPAAIAAVGVTNAAALAYVAWRWRQTWLLGLALPCFAFAFVAAWLGLAGHVEWASESGERLAWLYLGSNSSFSWMTLMPLGLLAAEIALRGGRKSGARFCWLGAMLASLAGLASIAFDAWSQPAVATALFGMATAGAIAAAVRHRQRALSWLGVAVSFGVFAFAVRTAVPAFAIDVTLLVALTVYALTIGLGGVIVGTKCGATAESEFGMPMRTLALAASIAALAPWGMALRWEWLWPGAGAMAALSLWWGIWSRHETQPLGFALCQMGTGVAAMVAATAWMHASGEIATLKDLTSAGPMQGLLLALALWAMAWSVLRTALQRRQAWKDLFDPALPALDRAAMGLILAGQFALAVVGIFPDLAREIVAAGPFDAVHGVHLGRGFALVGILAAACGWRMASGRPFTGYLAMNAIGWTIPWLAAGLFRAEIAAASGMRWSLGLAFPLLLAATWARRRTIAKLPGWEQGEGTVETAGTIARGMALILGLGFAIVLTLATTERAFVGAPLGGPAAGTLFARMGSMASMLGPLALLALGLVGTGLIEAKPGYLFSAIVLSTATMVGGTALGMTQAGIRIDAPELVRLLQIGMLTASVGTLLWLALGRWRHLGYLAASVAFARLFSAPLLLLALLSGLFPLDGARGTMARSLAHEAGWIALVATMFATMGVVRFGGQRSLVWVVAVDAASMAILGACAGRGADPTGSSSIHVLMFALVGCGAGLLGVGRLAERLGGGDASEGSLFRGLREAFPAGPCRGWATAFASAAALFATVVGVVSDDHPSWAFSAAVFVCILFGLVAVWGRSLFRSYVSGCFMLVVGVVGWRWWLRASELAAGAPLPWNESVVEHAFLAEAAAIAVASLAWGLVERLLERAQRPIDAERQRMPFSHFGSMVSTFLLVATTAFGIFATADGFGWTVDSIAYSGALSLCMAAVLARGLDPEAKRWGAPAASLYAIGLAWVGFGLRTAFGDAASMMRALPVSLGAYAAGVGTLVWAMGRLRGRPHASWFAAVQVFVGSTATLLGLHAIVAEPVARWRWMGPAATALAATAYAFLAENAKLREGTAKTSIAMFSLLTSWFAMCEAGWAWLGADVPAPFLHGQVTMFAASLVALFAWGPHGLGRRRDGIWSAAATRLIPAMIWIGGVLLVAILGQEFVRYDRVARHTPLLWPAVLLLGVFLAVAVVGCVWTAVRRTDSERWSERTRKGLVWAAEGIFVVLLLHLRLNVPDIFPGYLGRQWPLVLMTLGFVATAAGEGLARKGVLVVADPLRTTGLALPMVPIFAFVLKPAILALRLEEGLPGMDPILRFLQVLPDSPALHASLWFLLGTLYLMVAGLRRSGNHLLMAALWANFGMWVILANQRGLELFLHPQLWLIPLGVILLAAEMLNRGKLSPGQRQSLRWLALTLIYVSSAADLFIAGLGDWRMATALAVLSVAGVFVGILLRVKAILFMASAFLALDVLAQIWHAAVDRQQTWIWWICGIVLGVAILVLFALFEKRRQDVERVLANLRKWE